MISKWQSERIVKEILKKQNSAGTPKEVSGSISKDYVQRLPLGIFLKKRPEGSLIMYSVF